MHYKTDLLTDEQMAKFDIKVGDIKSFNVPNADGGFTKVQCLVTDIEIDPKVPDPNKSGRYLTRVTLRLE
jgi:hypothetical protein